MSIFLLKAAATLCAALAGGWLAYVTLTLTDSPLHGLIRRHIARLNAMSARCLAPPTGARTTRLQALTSLAVVVAMATLGLHPLFGATGLLLIWGLPYADLEIKRQQRLTRIDESVAAFGMALANSLRASGNIARALDRSRSVVPAALAEELTVVQQELQLGVSIDEALRSLSDRVGSITLDLMLSGILIGRQIGGNLPEILETNSASIREMTRIQGVIRSKTAEGKGQLWVLALAPPVMFLAFDSVQAGFFEPLFTSSTGAILLGVAGLLWVAGLLAAKRILMVDI